MLIHGCLIEQVQMGQTAGHLDRWGLSIGDGVVTRQVKTIHGRQCSVSCHCGQFSDPSSQNKLSAGQSLPMADCFHCLIVSVVYQTGTRGIYFQSIQDGSRSSTRKRASLTPPKTSSSRPSGQHPRYQSRGSSQIWDTGKDTKTVSAS